MSESPSFSLCVFPLSFPPSHMSLLPSPYSENEGPLCRDPRTHKRSTFFFLKQGVPQDTTHLIQRPRYQRGSPCQVPAGNPTTRRPPDHGKETQTAVVWSCLAFIRSGQNHLARHSARGKKTRQTEEEVGRKQGMDRPGVRGCEIICGAQATHVVKG